MSQEMHGSQEFFAGAVPAERSGAGIAPAGEPPQAPVTPVPPDSNEGIGAVTGADSIAGEGGDAVPSVPILCPPLLLVLPNAWTAPPSLSWSSACSRSSDGFS